MRVAELDPASFRDPSGFVFEADDGHLYRGVAPCYEGDYALLMESGLYRELVDDGLLVSHEEVAAQGPAPAARLLRPRKIEFISYPYEWCFGQYKDAALLTLEVQLRALARGLTLKDASAYNVQFDRGRPIFIDTLSFERRTPGAPWVAYGQFCAHFLAPLALMSYRDPGLQRLMAQHLDGVPLALAARLLPLRARLRPGLFAHLFLHAWMQGRYAGIAEAAPEGSKPRRVSEAGSRGMVEGLKRLVSKLAWEPSRSQWSDYYATSSYSAAALEEKQRVVAEFLDRAAPGTVWDLGANTAVFSRLAAERGAATVAFDSDPACVELSYREMRSSGEEKLLPLVLDLTNPSPSLGWAHRERRSLAARGPADVLLMLAIVHHLAISNNVPLGQIAEWSRSLGRWAIVEYVPRDDPQAKKLLRFRRDHSHAYDREVFEREFSRSFEVVDSREVGEDGRLLYLLRAR